MVEDAEFSQKFSVGIVGLGLIGGEAGDKGLQCTRIIAIKQCTARRAPLESLALKALRILRVCSQMF